MQTKKPHNNCKNNSVKEEVPMKKEVLENETNLHITKYLIFN